MAISGCDVGAAWPVAEQLSPCRADASLWPHQSSLWHDGFPVGERPTAVCDGTIAVKHDGTICVAGRVTYRQIAQAAGRPIYAPAASTISLNGHLTTGSGNVVLGPSAHVIYDFVKSYEVNGTWYQADEHMVDRLFAASRGKIGGVCLDGTIAPRGPNAYSIESTRWEPRAVDVARLADASFIFVASHSVVAEVHRPVEQWGGWDSPFGMLQRPPILGGSSLGEALGMELFAAITAIPLPTFVVGLVPGLLGFTGLLRSLLVGGTFSTERFPQPLTAPDADVENIQVGRTARACVHPRRALPYTPRTSHAEPSRAEPTHATCRHATMPLAMHACPRCAIKTQPARNWPG